MTNHKGYLIWPGLNHLAARLKRKNVTNQFKLRRISANRAPSHVLKAIGVSDAQAQASVRFGLGRFNIEDEIRYVCLRLEKAVNKLRSMVPKSFGTR
ncbi:hypothetical protein O185_03330 [Photorhabdus temperata J3]|uniref:Cysteine desulfurase n=1 Tax=Photorhabdus temperata J3 TaxID=1389415 RepID=U7R3D5_PHOTE|nr:hypothetical protein O185_03330 [Photorhabdus temperata J3]